MHQKKNVHGTLYVRSLEVAHLIHVRDVLRVEWVLIHSASAYSRVLSGERSMFDSEHKRGGDSPVSRVYAKMLQEHSMYISQLSESTYSKLIQRKSL